MLTRLFLALLLATIFAPCSQAQSDLDGDTDGDGIIDRFDNCYVYPNPLQGDADADGWGNRCDTDLNNDGVINLEDLSVFRTLFLSSAGPADFNEDGIVNFLDLRVFRQLFGQGRPGPSTLMRWVGGSGSWHDASNWLPPQVPSLFFETAIINTADDVVVTVEEGRLAGAKNLELEGNLLVCGDYSTFRSTTVNGTLSTGCDRGAIYLEQGVDLAGEIALNSGVLAVTAFRSVGDAESVIRVAGNARLDSFFSDTISTDVDILLEPGSYLDTSNEIAMVNSSITLQSENELPAELFSSSGFSGTGNIRFEGPSDESATGVLRTFGIIELGPDIDVTIAPNAYAYLNGQIKNFGRIDVSDSATLFFTKFNLTTNDGQINCSNDGRLAEFETGLPSPGDSILFNNAGGELVAENCTMTWPTRVLNSGVYNVTSSQIRLPAIATSDFPLDITGTDISLEPFQPPVPDNFYLFDPANENSFVVRGLLDLGNEIVEIDASQWRFGSSPQSSGVNIGSGTLVSETPLKINAGIDVRFEAVVLETEITLEPAASMITGQIVGINKDIRFLAPENCDAAPSDPAVLRMNFAPLTSSNSTIRVESPEPAAAGEGNCLQAEIVTDRQVALPGGIDVIVSNAELSMRAEGNGSFTIEGDTAVSGFGSILTLQQITIANFLSCSDGATLFASGTNLRPFVNSTLLTGNNCNINFSGSWLNDGEVLATLGTLNLTGPENAEFAPGSGTFFTDRTDIFFDLDIGDPATLDVFKVIPPGGSFTFAGTVTNPGPVLDLSAFPFNTGFGDGFELADTRVTGFQTFQLSGSTTLRNVELALTTVVSSNSTLNVYDGLSLDNATLHVLADSLDGTPSTTSLLIHGVTSIAGTGELLLSPLGENAVSAVLQTVDDTALSVDAGISTNCNSGGLCSLKAGAGGGEIDLFGELTVSDETSRLKFESDTSLYRTARLLNRGQIRLADDTNLEFPGAGSGLEIALVNEPMQPGVVAEGSATIDITDASLAFVAGDSYVLESGEVVTVLSHENTAQRVGEFADVSEAAIDGMLFSPDYSSPNVTIFRGPDFESPATAQ